MGNTMNEVKSLAAGTAATVVADVIFHKGFKFVPFLNDRTILSRALLSGIGLLVMTKTGGITRDAALCWTSHNLADMPLHIEPYGVWVGLPNGVYDQIASEAVQSIEDKISEKIAGLKANVSGTQMHGNNMHGNTMNKRAEDVEYEEYINGVKR